MQCWDKYLYGDIHEKFKYDNIDVREHNHNHT